MAAAAVVMKIRRKYNILNQLIAFSRIKVLDPVINLMLLKLTIKILKKSYNYYSMEGSRSADIIGEKNRKIEKVQKL